MKMLKNKVTRITLLLSVLLISFYLGKTKYDKLFKENTVLYKERANMISYISLLEDHNKRTNSELISCRSDISRTALEIMGASIHPRIALLASSLKGEVSVTKRSCLDAQARIKRIILRIRKNNDFTPPQKRYLLVIVNFERVFHSRVCKEALGKL